jgi:hypothetical protein
MKSKHLFKNSKKQNKRRIMKKEGSYLKKLKKEGIPFLR